jgi:Holliday junction DNA helicase RuvA
MITYLRGRLAESLPTQCVVEVAGVGYEVLIPLSTYDRLPPPGGDTKLLTILVVREDAHLLYGFATAEERDLFRLLTSHVSGVGPRIALGILSGTTPIAFKGAVVNGDLAAISKIKGVGKKTAERIVVELRDKVGVSAAWEAASATRVLTPDERQANDAVLALIALGFKQAEAHKVVKAILENRPSLDTETLIREALKGLA